MKLKKLLGVVFDSIDTLTPTELELFKDTLMKCDEFKDVTELIIIDKPVFNDISVSTSTVLINEDTVFKNRVYLYSIFQTPEIYDPKKIHTTVKDGALITPILYDPKTFRPYREILFRVNLNSLSDELDKEVVHNLVDDVINNQKDYTVKGEKGILVRGIFETIETTFNDEIMTNTDVDKLSLFLSEK